MSMSMSMRSSNHRMIVFMVLMMILTIDVAVYHDDAGGLEVEEPQKKSMMNMI